MLFLHTRGLHPDYPDAFATTLENARIRAIRLMQNKRKNYWVAIYNKESGNKVAQIMKLNEIGGQYIYASVHDKHYRYIDPIKGELGAYLPKHLVMDLVEKTSSEKSKARIYTRLGKIYS